jgi:hypothetical protein
MAFVTRTVLGLVAWLAVRAGARFDLPGGAYPMPSAATAGPVPATPVLPNRAAWLVPVPDDPEAGRSLVAHWALWAAVALILLILAVGYVRRRWKSGERPAWFPWPTSNRDGPRK